jgi:hypothetical protein
MLPSRALRRGYLSTKKAGILLDEKGKDFDARKETKVI